MKKKREKESESEGVSGENLAIRLLTDHRFVNDLLKYIFSKRLEQFLEGLSFTGLTVDSQAAKTALPSRFAFIYFFFLPLLIFIYGSFFFKALPKMILFTQLTF